MICISFLSPPCIREYILGGLFNKFNMKRKAYIIYTIILILLIGCVIYTFNEIYELNVRVKDLEERTLNHEYRLEDIMPNDDMPHNFSADEFKNK